MAMIYSSADTDKAIENLEILLDRRDPQAGDVRARLTRLEAQMGAIIDAQKDIADQLGSVTAVLTAGKGAFQVLEFIGKVAKPLLWIAATIAGLTAALSNHKIG